jgi:hypothetical protein
MMADEIRGVFYLMGLREKGSGFFARETPCILCFTENRLIIAKHKSTFGRLLTERLGAWFVQSSATARERLKWKQLSADDYLREHPEKVDIPYSGISAIEVASNRVRIYGDNLDCPMYEIRTSNSGKNPDRPSSELLQFLRQYLPGKV